MRRLLIVLCTAALVLPIAALARLPYDSAGADDARLRFSWRMSIAAKETCRPRTQAELDALPVHMRTPEVCTRDVADYSLITRVDGLRTDTMELVRGGVKGDRPLFVLEERTLPPGEHRIHVVLERRTATGATSSLAALDTTLRLRRGHVALVTLDGEAQRLGVRASVR